MGPTGQAKKKKKITLMESGSSIMSRTSRHRPLGSSVASRLSTSTFRDDVGNHAELGVYVSKIRLVQATIAEKRNVRDLYSPIMSREERSQI